jgi:hypothetical protein
VTELSRYFFLAGALPFIFLGLAHARATPFGVDDRKGLSPSDATLGAAMAKAHLRLSRRTDVWNAWVSFNLTHSLGAVLFGAFVLVLGRNTATFEQNALFALPLSVVTSATYLAIGLKYWFRIPIAGCAIATACFLASTLLRLFS